jgi:undecaprenyl-diphosphatase
LSDRRLAIAAAVAFAVFLVLGSVVSQAPAGALDRWAQARFFGEATPLAAALTKAGTFPYYLALSLAALAIGLARRTWLPRAIVAVVTLVLAWQTSDVFKALFHRPRPEHWLVYPETSYSYASGHAVLATAFWGVWLVYVLRTLPPSAARTLLVLAVCAWVLAIGWSRLALGAHYLSDVVGGYLLGAAFVCVAAIAVRRLERRPA